MHEIIKKLRKVLGIKAVKQHYKINLIVIKL